MKFPRPYTLHITSLEFAGFVVLALITSTRHRMPPARILIVLIPALWVDWVQYRRSDELVFICWPRLAQASWLALGILAVFLMSQANTGVPFVYQGF